jgi:hypothetical protein
VKKVVIIALAVIVGIMIVLLIVRPGRREFDTGDPPGLFRALNELAPHHDVKPDDVAGQRCWDDAGQLVAALNELCVTRLPQGADRVSICLAQGELTEFAISGDKYGPQKPDGAQLRCEAGGETFDLYDDNSTLTVTCNVPCLLRLQ